jgi:hypothetical protein
MYSKITDHKTVVSDDIREEELRITERLLMFVDFIYALVFALVVDKTYEQVVDRAELDWLDKGCRIALVIAVFYFLFWDWVRGRQLTLRYQYRHFGRFYLELGIAAFGYGVAQRAVEGSSGVPAFVAAILLCGFLWSFQTMYEHREVITAGDADAHEVRTIFWHQMFGFVACVAWWAAAIDFDSHAPMPWYGCLTYAVLVLIYISWYQCRSYKHHGLRSGPGAPLLRQSWIRRAQAVYRSRVRLSRNRSAN